VLLALLVTAAPAATPALDDITRLALDVELEHQVETVSTHDLRRRLVGLVTARRPAIALDAASTDRLRLTVAVRPYSSAALRGFPLPFSGTYAIGVVRLGLERAVQLPGPPPRSVPAIVWQRERIVATRWAVAGTAITDAVQQLLDALR
jgi:hypothetical protein